MEGCFNSLAEADSLGIPVRHVFLLPFAPAKFTHTTFHNMRHQRPNDCRILITLPESTYSFWMFGYWLGRNKLAKTDRLAYQDGHLAFFIMDNAISRETQPITEQTLKLFAQWSRTQQPDYFQDQARWQNELANVPRTQSNAHDNLDYPTLRATAERWLSSISSSANPPLFHFSLPEISIINPPCWLIDELCLGGMANYEATSTAKTITALIRNPLIDNWTLRNTFLPQDSCKFKLTTRNKARNVRWGKKTPDDNSGNPPPNVDNPSSDEEDEEFPNEMLRDHKTLRYRTPPTEVPPSPKRHCYQTMGTQETASLSSPAASPPQSQNYITQFTP